jgi:hypothetical protein
MNGSPMRRKGYLWSLALLSLAAAVFPTVASGRTSVLSTMRIPAAARTATAHVRWSGFHGVKFGEPLSAAAKKLHGTVRSDEPRSDARYVSYPGPMVAISGSMRWEGSDGLRYQVRSGRTVGSFQALGEGVTFPRGAFVGESLARFKRSLGKGARPQRPEHNAAVGYYLVGPHGRTLWAWGSKTTGTVTAIGLAESLAGARVDWGNEG